MNDATNIVIIAAGDKYFQQIIQYKEGREPVIISISSAKLWFQKVYIKQLQIGLCENQK